MPVASKAYSEFISQLDSIVHNPSRNFLKDADLLNFAKTAVTRTAMRIGGIHFIDTSQTTVADQRDYTSLDNSIKRIKMAHYIKNINTSTEEASLLEVVSQKTVDFVRARSEEGVSTENNAILTGVSSETPKYILFWPETNTFRLMDTPSRTGDTLKLWCLGVPKELGTTSIYDGDQMETEAIVLYMAKQCRLKSREYEEAAKLDQFWQEACQDVIKMRGKTRQVRQVADGRLLRTRLRSFNGAK